MTKPNSYLSRSPVFKQNYWGWVLGNIGEMNKKTQTKFIKDARAAKIPKQFIEEMVSSAKFKVGKLDDFELLSTQAKGFGLAATKQLLYDASKKHKLSDITRNIFDLGKAEPDVLLHLCGDGVQNRKLDSNFGVFLVKHDRLILQFFEKI